MTEYLAVIKAYNTHKGIRFYHTSSSYNSSGDACRPHAHRFLFVYRTQIYTEWKFGCHAVQAMKN